MRNSTNRFGRVLFRTRTFANSCKIFVPPFSPLPQFRQIFSQNTKQKKQATVTIAKQKHLQIKETMFNTKPSLYILVLTAITMLSSCHAGLRGGQVHNRKVMCSEELDMEIVCKDDNNCNFDKKQAGGTCETKLFKYNGGTCPSLSSSAKTITRCEDVNHGPSSVDGTKVFVVIIDIEDPTKTTKMWTNVGEFFMTDYKDFPDTDSGLSENQNITIYSSDETSYETMLQTMIIDAPCSLGTSLEDLGQPDGQNVQYYGYAFDPTIQQAKFDININSLTKKTWALRKLDVRSASYQQLYSVLEEVPVDEHTIAPQKPFRMPWTVELEYADQQVLEASVLVVSEFGEECHMDASFDSTSFSIKKQDNNKSTRGSGGENPDLEFP